MHSKRSPLFILLFLVLAAVCTQPPTVLVTLPLTTGSTWSQGAAKPPQASTQPLTADERVTRVARGKKEIVQKYRALILRLMDKDKIPGLAIALVDKQGIVWAEGFGHTDWDGKAAVTPETPFSMQSISKVITATAVLVAVQLGLLDLDAPITQYLPGFVVQSRFDKDAGSMITLKRLLSHTAGLTHEAPVGNNFDSGRASFENHVASISSTWLRYPVGERYSYSNLGVDVAGYALQRVCGQPFAECARRLVLDPIGMENSSFDLGALASGRALAVGHDSSSSKVPVEIPMVPSGGLYSSAKDMARFLVFQLNDGKTNRGRLLSKRLMREMRTVPFPVRGQMEGYALGVDVWKRHGRTYFNHGGGGFGFLADLVWNLEHGVGVVVLTNSVNHTLQGALPYEILDEFAGPSPHQPARRAWGAAESSLRKAESDLDRAVLGNYVGRSYDLDVVEAGGALAVRRDSVLRPIWFSPEGDALVGDKVDFEVYRFVPASGRPRYLLRVQDGVTWDYNEGPNDPPGPSKREWQDYIGEYSYEVWGRSTGIHKVHLKGGYLYLDHLRLQEYEPGLFFAPMGEALDLRSTNPTWRSIRISKVIDK